jgi:uncharacterized protein (TIGR03663 family)
MEKKEIIVLITIFILIAAFTRFSSLNSRPLHLDEAVDWLFAKNIIDGNGYTYDPANYHGTIYYYLISICFLNFGVSEYSLRMISALAGVSLIILALFIKFKNKKLGNYCGFIIAGFLLVSPSFLYYSRDCRQESLLILFSFLAIYFLTKIFENKNFKYLPYFSIFLALAFVTKETTMILAVAIFVICIFNFKKLKSLNYKENHAIILLSVVIFIFIWIMFFTSLFTNMAGFPDSFKSVIGWGSHGISEHNKPFYYFINLIIRYELPLLILGILGIFYSYKTKDIFSKNISIWFIVIFIIYGLIPYKTPWLVINMTVPLCFLSGIAIINLYNKKEKLAIILFSIAIVYLSIFSIYLCYTNPWQESNKYAYVHTDKEILDITDKINLDYKYNSKILIVSDDYWPLPFYLRDKTVFYFNPKDFNISEYQNFSKEYDFIIVSEQVWREINNSYKNIPYMARNLNSNRVELYLIETKKDFKFS